MFVCLSVCVSAMTLICLILLACWTDIRRSWPTNFIVLTVFVSHHRFANNNNNNNNSLLNLNNNNNNNTTHFCCAILVYFCFVSQQFWVGRLPGALAFPFFLSLFNFLALIFTRVCSSCSGSSTNSSSNVLGMALCTQPAVSAYGADQALPLIDTIRYK